MSGEHALALAGLLLLAVGLLATFTRTLEQWRDRFVAWRAARSSSPRVKHSRVTRAMIMSAQDGSADIRTGSANPQTTPVRADTYQLEPVEPAQKNEAPDRVISHNMDDKTLTILLASQRTTEGKPRWSANEIVKMIGGTRQEVLDTIAIVRPREKAAEAVVEKPAGRMERPVEGWK